MESGVSAESRVPAGAAVLFAAIASAVVVIGIYLALGGATYKPLEVADPCDPRPEPAGEERGLAEQLALSALDGAACSLRVPREELALALATPEARAEFADQHNLSDESIEAAVDAGLERAIADAEADGDLSSLEAGLLRRAADAVPVGVVIDALQTSAGQSALEIAEDLLRDFIG
jgi:hypothetical protein